MKELTGAERRQLIDCEQVFSAWRADEREYNTRFRGSMSWKRVGGNNYLYRKNAGAWKCLGAESAETRLTYDRFHAGREALKARLASLDRQIRAQAKISRAMDLGRVPLATARVLRRLDQIGSLGRGIRVAGTNALYAYERMAGVHFSSDLAATLDVDLLYDARGGLDLVASHLAETGLIGLLRKIDASFEPVGDGSYRAVNDKGFMVDLITPATRNPATREFRQRLGDDPGDLRAVEIEGLTWLESSPAVELVAIDERGFPLMIVAPDPRSFICHKIWVARRADRDPLKRFRDEQQAIAVCRALVAYLPDLRFDDPAVQAMPSALREEGLRLVRQVEGELGDSTSVGDWR
jgi:hypothetical protein